ARSGAVAARQQPVAGRDHPHRGSHGGGPGGTRRGPRGAGDPGSGVGHAAADQPAAGHRVALHARPRCVAGRSRQHHEPTIRPPDSRHERHADGSGRVAGPRARGGDRDMSWLFPAGILAGISLVAIVLLHMRHRLPEVITFPQLAFWPRVPSETRESPRWRKPPLTLLFILQLLAALLLVLAFMRPAIPGFGAFGGQRTSAIHHVVVLDGSTSMLATGEEPGSRWDAALESLDDVLGDWQQGDGVTVIVASARP